MAKQHSEAYQQALNVLQRLVLAEGLDQLKHAYDEAIALNSETSPATKDVIAQYVRPSRAKGAQGPGAQGRAHLGAQPLMQRPKLAMSQEEACDELGISMKLFTQERDAGRIKVLQIGRRRVVAYASLVAYVKRVSAEQGVTLDEHTLSNWEQEPPQHTKGPSQRRGW